jgi:hypothetical protein
VFLGHCGYSRKYPSSGGGTRKIGISLSKYRVAILKGIKGTTKGTPSSNGVSVTPTLLAQIWGELGEAEQGKVEQVILDFVEAQQDIEVDRENGRYAKECNTN